jgi:GT2 family glycosyltransferase
MRLSVITVNWNSREDLATCLRSLARQTHQDLEVIVVDNGSADGSAAMVREEFPSVKLLAETENLGFAEACNRGIEASTGAWVALLNNDAWVEDDWAAATVRAAAGAPGDVAMLQSLMLFQGKEGVVNSTGIQLKGNGSGVDRGEHQPRERFTCADEIFCPTGGAAVYRRDMLDRLKMASGYLDRRYFLYYEDLDLGWRARLSGYRALLVPDAVVHHRYHGSTDRLGKHRLFVLASGNRIRTLLKNASPQLMVQALPSLGRDVARVALRGGRSDLVSLGKAVVDGLATRPRITSLLRHGRREVERRWVDRLSRAAARRRGRAWLDC